MVKHARCFIIGLTMALSMISSARAQGQPPLPTVQLQAGLYLIKAEVAATYATRMHGLMMREKMGPNEGMLFVFPERERQCMWMKNTLLPLSVAFIDDNGAILNVEDMKPLTEDSHCSARPARYALEMNLGWFKSKNILPGTRIVGLEKAGPPR
ncbi:MAG: DUF192 domain-containing protein [Burkholderiales bacterium]|nr:DUF192 domain-containing protein [Burkholderiales bacterium]